MTGPTLQRVWDARKAISQRCEYDSHKLVRFYQSRTETENRTKEPTTQTAILERPAKHASS
jgi:hypothetical protein